MPDYIGYVTPSGNTTLTTGHVDGGSYHSNDHFGSGNFAGFFDGSNSAVAQANAQWEMQQNQQAYNSAEAEKNRQWEQQMRDTSIQSAFDQYKSVGVNPYLAVMQGSQGVTSASGEAASSGQGSVSKATQNLTSMMASAAGVGLALAKIIKALK